MVKKPKFSSEEGGIILPFFALTSIVMLLFVLLIMDIGQIRIVQSDAYKATDAGALAGAVQSDYYEENDYKQKRTREPVYKNGKVDRWKYVTNKTLVNKKEWAEIRENDAKKEVDRLFQKNAEQTTLADDIAEVLNVDSQLTDKDKIEVWSDVKVHHEYFPQFIENFYEKENLPKYINV